MKKFLKQIAECIFPNNFTCDLCGREIFDGGNFCAECAGKIILNNKNTCPLCGRRTNVDQLCLDCKAQTPLFDRAASALIYDEGTVALIHKFKNGNAYLRDYFARLIAEKCKNFTDAQAICFIPMTKKDIKKRGYNQSELIARSLSEILGLPVLDNALVKTKNTAEQKTLSKREREKNLKGCFKADKCVTDKILILVDDVLTTGSTADAACYALKRACADKVYFVSAASVPYKKEI